ncbi:LysR substrate-binding domain-containing protein [Azoarcus taiwanensis]|uniref:LysR substrate-binding domain-containing protein n=1 Tax=Azoarcus taiwanensis TaxID=666964 RepID=UPI0030DD8875
MAQRIAHEAPPLAYVLLHIFVLPVARMIIVAYATWLLFPRLLDNRSPIDASPSVFLLKHFRPSSARWATLSRVARGVHIEVVDLLSAETAQMLKAGEVDLALGFMPQLEARFCQQSLFRQQYVCLVSLHHPRIQGSLDLVQFETEDHAVVVTSGTGHMYVDKELARQNITRKIAVRLGEMLSGRGVSLIPCRFRYLTMP